MTATALSTIGYRGIPTGLIPVVINDSSASLTVVAAVAGKITEVWGACLFVNGVTDITFKSASTDISGPLPLGITTNTVHLMLPIPVGRVITDCAAPYFTTASGEALVIANSGSSIRLSGLIWITQRNANQNLTS